MRDGETLLSEVVMRGHRRSQWFQSWGSVFGFNEHLYGVDVLFQSIGPYTSFPYLII